MNSDTQPWQRILQLKPSALKGKRRRYPFRVTTLSCLQQLGPCSPMATTVAGNWTSALLHGTSGRLRPSWKHIADPQRATGYSSVTSVPENWQTSAEGIQKSRRQHFWNLILRCFKLGASRLHLNRSATS